MNIAALVTLPLAALALTFAGPATASPNAVQPFSVQAAFGSTLTVQEGGRLDLSTPGSWVPEGVVGVDPRLDELVRTNSSRVICLGTNNCYLQSQRVLRDSKWHKLPKNAVVFKAPVFPQDTNATGSGSLAVVLGMKNKWGSSVSTLSSSSGYGWTAQSLSATTPGPTVPAALPGPVGKPLGKHTVLIIDLAFTANFEPERDLIDPVFE